MLLIIPELISRADAEALRLVLGSAHFVEGRRSAGPSAIGRKRNLELADDQQVPAALVRSLTTAMKTHAVLNSWALPRRSAPLLFNRYDAGMAYGDHVDNALGIVGGEFVRSDLSVTIFLSPVEDYEGGELVVASDGPARRFKLPAGHAVVYDAGTLHRVEPVTRGSRLAAVTWIESLVRSPEKRRILHDLAVAIEGLGTDAYLGHRVRLEKCRTNLLRRWAEP